jgi:hypothetical protein
MGFFDKMKGAMNFVTGGAAKVSIEWHPATAMPGEPIGVRVTATSTGPQLSSGGVFVDVIATEIIKIPQNALGNNNPPIDYRNQTYSHQFQIAPAFQLAPNETKQFEGQIVIPQQSQPSYDGRFFDHEWSVQGRIEASGNDPDSGWLKLRVGAR